MMTNAKKTILRSLKEYLELQLREILSDFNRWVTGEKVRHSPTEDELATNYLENGGPERFAETHAFIPDQGEGKRE